MGSRMNIRDFVEGKIARDLLKQERANLTEGCFDRETKS